MSRTTLIFLVLAAASAAGAYSMRPIEIPPVEFDEVGLPLFEGFTDPSQAQSLEVQAFDDDAAGLRKFAVAFKEGRWLIPSHNDYPADATERMGKAAASFIGVTKDQVRSDSANEHAEFGVQDPASPEAAEGGRGVRFTIADASGTKFVDVIVGKDVPERRGFKYVRLPDSDRVYTARLDLDVSTKFTDWIEDDLLKIERDSIVAVISNSYTVDEETGRVNGHKPLRFDKQAGAAGDEWVLVGPPEGWTQGIWPLGAGAPAPAPAGKTVDTSKVRQIISGIDMVKLAGVRPQPQRLTQDALMRVGFFVSPDAKQLFGNEGEVAVLCNDGVIYTLYFGEISYQTGEALTAGSEAETEAKPEEGGKAHRYMFVNVSYNRGLDTTAPPPPAPAEGEDPPAPPPETGPTEGEKRAAKLRQRFDRWFYVVSNSSFDQMHKAPADFWKDAPG
jgi:hypothetical protein